MKELKYNLKLLINKKETYFAFLLISFINLIHVFLTIQYYSNANVFYESGYKAEYLSILYAVDVTLRMIIIVVFPILCTTIFSDSTLYENNKKINIMLKTRVRKKQMIMSKFFVTFISTFIICLVGFLFNYVTLLFIYGSGNAITYFQSPAFHLIGYREIFLDSLRLSNPILFELCICIHVSFLIGLLSILSYAISFFVKHRIFVYVFPFMFLLFSEFVLEYLNLEKYAPITQLQPFSFFSINDMIILNLFILLISLILIKIAGRKKDIL